MFILTLAIFIFILGLLVFVHEFGHFVTAKKAGLWVQEFGFGLPPRAVGIVRKSGPASKGWRGRFRVIYGHAKVEEAAGNKTIYSLNWIPLGGFVKIYGEEGEGKGDERSFINKKPGTRALILFSGVTMNVILAAILITIGFFVGLPQVVTDDNVFFAKNIKIEIVDVAAGSPAQTAGLKIYDAILKISEPESGDFALTGRIEDVQSFTKKYLGKTLMLEIQRQEQVMQVSVFARKDAPEGQGAMGIAMAQIGIVSYPWYRNIWEGLKSTLVLLLDIILAFYFIIKNLIFAGKVVGGLSGPVGIFSVVGEATRLGFIYLLQFTALISLNLAVINAIPFPALDGGRALFVLIEKIKGSPVNQKVEQIIHAVGFALLILLIVLITFRDIGKLI